MTSIRQMFIFYFYHDRNEFKISRRQTFNTIKNKVFRCLRKHLVVLIYPKFGHALVSSLAQISLHMTIRSLSSIVLIVNKDRLTLNKNTINRSSSQKQHFDEFFLCNADLIVPCDAMQLKLVTLVW
jgi:hypothetical protein